MGGVLNEIGRELEVSGPPMLCARPSGGVSRERGQEAISRRTHSRIQGWVTVVRTLKENPPSNLRAHVHKDNGVDVLKRETKPNIARVELL